MNGCDIRLDVQLQRPQAVAAQHWVDALVHMCCRREVPHLESFRIDAEGAQLSIAVPSSADGGPRRLAGALQALAAACSTLGGSPTTLPAAPAPQ